MQIRAYQQSNLDKFGCIYNYNSRKRWSLYTQLQQDKFIDKTH